MLNCEFCSTGKTGTIFTKCCKGLICGDCCEKLDKKLVCICGRPLSHGRKNYSEYPQIMSLLKQFVDEKGKQCDRCECKAEIDCNDCQMVYCQSCNIQVHTGFGFSKHLRRKLSDSKGNVERMRRKQPICINHKQNIVSGCECGVGLCQVCTKQHKEVCIKGCKTRPLKEFKDEYYLNVLLKMRQLSFFKQRLVDDSKKYADHFQTQKINFNECNNLISEQFDYLKKMIETKQAQVNTKLIQYWSNCQNVYRATCQKIDDQIKKYDQYGQLLQTFAENLANLEYFDKKIRRFNINFQFTNIKNVNIEQAQSAIMGIGITQKPWESIGADFLPSEHNDNKPLAKDDAHILSTLQNTSELMVDYTQNPLRDRQLNLLPSHAEVHYSFIHLPYQNVKYEVQYGVGMKMKGQQIFKRIHNLNGFGCIEGLNPNTTYRIRMRVADSSWGPIQEITTLELPKFNIQTSSCAKQMGDNVVQLGKGGLIYGSNQIHFGIHKWIFKLTSKAISYEDTQTACMSVGVSNKQTKKATFVGTTFNYGYQKSQTVLKIILDCNQKKMVIMNSATNKQEIYQNLPNFPLFPTLQNKGNSQMMVRYNLTSDDSNSC